MALSVDDIRKKLQNDPEWEPTDADTGGDPDFWEKFDEAMDSIHVPGGSDDEEDLFGNEDVDWEDDDDGDDW